jgi:hypothetical protein
MRDHPRRYVAGQGGPKRNGEALKFGRMLVAGKCHRTVPVGAASNLGTRLGARVRMLGHGLAWPI